MKNYLLILTLSFLTTFSFGQKLPFQGKLIESGTPVTETRDFEFSIANPAWSETHTGVTITDGLYFVVLGSNNPLPDSLFYGVNERQLSISVNGVALSPVTLFKPLSGPFEGTDISLTNSEGDVKAQLYLPDDNTGMINFKGRTTGDILEGFRWWEGDAGADLPFLSYSTRNHILAHLTLTNTIDANNDTTSAGYFSVRSSDKHGLSLTPHQLYMQKDNIFLSQLLAHNQDGLGYSALFDVRGPSSINVEIRSRYWENPDLPQINLIGENDFLGMDLSILPDGNGDQYGFINLMSENGSSSHLDPNNFNLSSSDGMSSSWSPRRFEMFAGNRTLSIENFDYSGQGATAHFKLDGPNSNNIEMAGQHWKNPDLPFMKFNGSDGSALAAIIADVDNGVENGRIAVSSQNHRLTQIKPTYVAITNGDDWQASVFISAETDGSDWYGKLDINGPNSNNVSIGSQGNHDLPWMTLHATGHNAIELGCTDNEYEEGFINMYANNGDYMSYGTTGISGSVPIEIQNGANITGTLNLNGDFTGSGTEYYSSDRRLKTNIQLLDKNVLQKVDLLKGVSYNWRQDEFPDKNFSSDKQIGVIAQELEAQFPELVKTNADGYKSVNYNGFTAVLLEAVKELNAKVEKLEGENTQLKAELSTSANTKYELDQLKTQVAELIKLAHGNSEELTFTQEVK